MKSEAEHFIDWEGYAFGFGYGTGEPHVLPALKAFFANFDVNYDYEQLERALTPAVAWLLINALCDVDVIEYGSSPRYGWLTPQGERLKKFVETHTAGELVRLCTRRGEDYIPCYPDACNCGPEGYEKERDCRNPFWISRTSVKQ